MPDEAEKTDTTPEQAPAADAAPAPAPAPELPRIHMETSEGPLDIELWPDAAPKTAANFHQLVHDGFYDQRTPLP